MKRFIVIIFASIGFVSCDNSKALRHLFRASKRANKIEQNEPVKTKKDYLITFSQDQDSLGNTVYKALYTLPKDTNMFFLNLSYNMPEKLGFDGRMDSCTVNAFFFKSVADTTNNKFVLEKSFAFTKNGQFYRIESK